MFEYFDHVAMVAMTIELSDGAGLGLNFVWRHRAENVQDLSGKHLKELSKSFPLIPYWRVCRAPER
jgi:hypothetical protein